MKKVALILLMAIAGTSVVAAPEKVAVDRVISVGLFKNGLAVVTREVGTSGAGTYLVANAPSPVHGTFWVESEHEVDVRVTMRDMEVAPQSNTATDFQEQLSGRVVTVHFKEQAMPPITGKIVSTERPQGDDAWNRLYQPQPHYYNYYRHGNQASPTSQFLILETKDSREYVDTSMIARVTISNPSEKVTERKPVMLMTTKNPKPSTIRMSYLAKGLSWAPSYRVDISDENNLTIEQKAIIKNELMTFNDAKVFLISGFPSVQFGHVTSPLSLQQTWATFFQQLNTQIRPGQGFDAQVLSQQAIAFNTVAPGGLDMSATPHGEGPDIHYQSVGEQTMAEGDSIMLSVATAKTSYDRIVEWIVPDTRSADGRHIAEHERRQNPDKYQDAVWDALRFKNPFHFPMTTGAAMISSMGKFLGERTSFWVSQGEETTLHITKALRVRSRSSEHEEPDSRKQVDIGGRSYFQNTVKGELVVNNHREEKLSMVIRRRFSGELMDSTGDPKCVLREEGLWSVNKRNELTWSVTIKPGEEQTLSYRYTVLVPR